MKRQERISKDRNALKEQGYRKIKLVNLYDYFDNYETCVTVYKAKIGKETHFKYLFINELNPDVLWEQIKTGIEQDILSYHFDFLESGLVYNALIEKDNKKQILLIKYNPTDGEITMKAARFDGES